MLNPNASCVRWAFFLSFFFFTGCNRCLSSAARSRANRGILIIALATGTGLVVCAERACQLLAAEEDRSKQRISSHERFSAASCSKRLQSEGGWSSSLPLQLINQCEGLKHIITLKLELGCKKNTCMYELLFTMRCRIWFYQPWSLNLLSFGAIFSNPCPNLVNY